MNNKWHHRFLHLAETVAQWSKDPSTKVGSVIVRPDRSICSLGYNGFPRTLQDEIKYLEDRAVKYSRVVHAELNAILSAREPVAGYTCYTWPFAPCDRCAVTLIQAGITEIVTLKSQDEERDRRNNVHLAKSWLDEAGVSLLEL